MPSPFSTPLRSWRAVLVAVCLSGTALVFAALAYDVRQANAALSAMAGAALHNYAAAAGQGLAADLLQRTTEFRMALFAPITGTRADARPAPSIQSFAIRAESLYRAARFDPDPLRGYLRYDLGNGSWEAEGALADSAFAAMVTDTLRGRVAGSMVAQAGLIAMPWRGTVMSTTYIPFADRVNHRVYLYVVSQTRSLAIHRPMADALATTPLLPPSITGHVWRAGDSTLNRGNDALIGVRVVGADGSLLYASPRWFAGPFRATYQFQAGAGGFTIETVLPPSLAERLVPAAVREVRRSLYVGLALVGMFLLAVSAVAFWGELAQQRKARARSMSELTTGLRHELNNALASVLLEAQLLAENEDALDDARAAGSAIAEQAERMRNVLRRLDHVEQLPVVDYFDGKSMVDLTETSPT